MMIASSESVPFSEEDVARRREATLMRMLATPHVPHQAVSAARRRPPSLGPEAPGGCEAP
jgi:hypothetical protein